MNPLSAELAAIAETNAFLTPDEAAALARRAAGHVDLTTLERAGSGEALLLWRNDHTEAWLNTWWEPRDTGYHDHDGSCVGVHVLEGVARNEPLVVGGSRQVSSYGPGESFSFPGTGIHRMDHEPGAITIHVYSPPLRTIGHYDLVDGALERTRLSPDDPSAPSAHLLTTLAASSR